MAELSKEILNNQKLAEQMYSSDEQHFETLIKEKLREEGIELDANEKKKLVSNPQSTTKKTNATKLEPSPASTSISS